MQVKAENGGMERNSRQGKANECIERWINESAKMMDLRSTRWEAMSKPG